MAIVRWKRASFPEAPREISSQDFLDQFQEDWSRFFGWPRFSEAAGLFDRSSYPLVDLLETEEGCEIWVEVPGLDKKDLDLSIAAQVLTIKGEKKGLKQDPKDGARLYRDEIWTGSFHRSISLPDSVDPDKVNAEFRDGLLKVFVAKKKEHKPRQIPVAVR